MSLAAQGKERTQKLVATGQRSKQMSKLICYEAVYSS